MHLTSFGIHSEFMIKLAQCLLATTHHLRWLVGSTVLWTVHEGPWSENIENKFAIFRLLLSSSTVCFVSQKSKKLLGSSSEIGLQIPRSDPLPYCFSRIRLQGCSFKNLKNCSTGPYIHNLDQVWFQVLIMIWSFNIFQMI